MKLVLLLGPKDRYVGFQSFDTEKEAESFLEILQQIIELNLQDALKLQSRLKSFPIYFPQIGLIHNFEYIDFDDPNTITNNVVKNGTS